MITGQRPFPGRYEAAVMYAITNNAPAPVESLREDVPSYLSGIVTRLLEKKIADRYQSASDVLRGSDPLDLLNIIDKNATILNICNSHIGN